MVKSTLWRPALPAGRPENFHTCLKAHTHKYPSQTDGNMLTLTCTLGPERVSEEYAVHTWQIRELHITLSHTHTL